ncbi:MAG TPA: methyltransferase domain-containing protein [Coleofasciculaceae cyanobacterium]|jgi:predicted SAM-dependent methyltransferase
MDRKEKVLRHINSEGQGIEIGPSLNPVATKKAGYKVHIIDHMSREQLMEKYKNHPINIENIEEVDFIWQGERYSELTGKSKFYDWIIASHVIEHTPDLIGFLCDCDTILKDDGVVSLVVPDKRYCFDHYRPITGLAKVIDSHLHKNLIHTPGTAAEYYLNVVAKAGSIAWRSSTTGDYNFVHSLEDALHGMKLVLEDKAYLDVHAWCFVPHSFRLMIHDLFCLGYIPLQEVDFFPTQGCEFYITLGRKGKGINRSRLEMLDTIESEVSEGIS